MSDIEMAMRAIVQIISDKISTDALNDSEKAFADKLLEVEQQNESVGSMLKLSAIAALLAVPNLLPVTSLAKELSRAKQQGKTLTMNSPATKKAIANAAKQDKMVGGMSETNVVNAIAQVLWKEARGEGTAGMDAVASVILNRTGNDPSYIVAVLKQPGAFSCMNDYAGGWTDATYRWYLPWKELT